MKSMSKDKTTGCCVLNFKDLKILTDLLVEMLDIVSKLKVTTRHEYIFLLSKVVVTISNYLNWNSQNKLKDVVYENTVEKELKREDRGEKVIANLSPFSPFNSVPFLTIFLTVFLGM